MNFVLVHGGWHGGWCWQAVADKLRSAGHKVFAPTLTGLGERKHLISLVDGPDFHVQDICNVIHWNELDNVVLIGHSYGGMIITGVASQMPEQISSLVYLDAFVPTETQTPATSMSTPARAAEIAASILPDGTISPTGFERWTSSPKTLAQLKRLCTPHPASCFKMGVTLSGSENSITNKVFVIAGKHKPSPFWQFYERYRDDPTWCTHQVNCLHDIMLEKPDELVRILLEVKK